jgi:hypothetical protein
MLPSLVLDSWPGGAINLGTHWSPAISVVFSTLSGADSDIRTQLWQPYTADLRDLNAELVFVEARPLAELRDWLGRNFAYRLIADPQLLLASRLELPTTDGADSLRTYDELTFLIHNCEVTKIFYPSGDPADDVATVLDFLRAIRG